MKPLYRKPQNKHRAAKAFNNSTNRTKAANVRVMRGGIRF